MIGQPAPDAFKVLIYATRNDQLLVFDEPDFPEVALQVPGGTVESGEDVLVAARREFAEETGLDGRSPFTLLTTDDYRFVRNDREIRHRRSCFHVELAGKLPETWIHSEMTPFGGGPPIRFRFFWMPIDAAARKLGYGMEQCPSLISR
ncbi:NUDIX domain-containing protein [Pararhizobium sp. BT-229]|uniref:NUDIX hydrolase n=1 Tax=Pararhizobium sp. BT-229 TaxID=2986923 RepID=UPI0021F6D3E1|nr:NUDIX domain-containing protein [Pararhizobium sp. BT-229]MCV9965531.1 NUDIX domain-containing protein [Pararhizobium sp. BT-229]